MHFKIKIDKTTKKCKKSQTEHCYWFEASSVWMLVESAVLNLYENIFLTWDDVFYPSKTEQTNLPMIEFNT